MMSCLSVAARTATLSLGFALALTGAAQAQTPPASGPAAPAAPATAPADPARVVARVDGQPITEADLAIAAEDPALSLPGTEDSQRRDILVGYAIDLKLGAKAATAAKIAESLDFQKKLAYLRDKLLVDEYLDAETRKAVTPAAAQALYDETVKEMKPEEEVSARHLLVADEDAAKAALARIKGGEDFAKVAAEVSTDPGSKTDGGDLGYFTRERMVGPFAEAAFKLGKGELSEPVKTQFGWHVIRVEDKRVKPVPAFAEMKDQIDQYLTRKTQQDIVLALRRDGKVERLDRPAAPAAGAPAAAPAPKP